MDRDGELTNNAFRAVLLGVEDVVGPSGMATVLRQAALLQYVRNYPPPNMEPGGHRQSYVSRVDKALFDIYGERGARAILQQVGRGQARSGMADNPALVNATRLALRFMPRRLQIKFVLDTVTKQVNAETGTAAKIIEEGADFYFDDPTCTHCIGWQHGKAVCYVVAGFMGQVLSRMIEGCDFKVEEIACFAKGDASCRFRIQQITD